MIVSGIIFLILSILNICNCKEKEIKSKLYQTEQKLLREIKKVNKLEQQVQELQNSGGGRTTVWSWITCTIYQWWIAAPSPQPAKNEHTKHRKMNTFKDIDAISNTTKQGTGCGLLASDGLEKYRKMIKMGVDKNGVVNKMKRDGISQDIMMKYELTGHLPGDCDGGVKADPISDGKAQAAPSQAPDAGISDKFEKYRKMIKMKVPKNGVINKMTKDKISIDIIQKYEETGQLPGDPDAAPQLKSGEGRDGPSKVSTSSAKSKQPQWPKNLKPKPEIKPSRKMRSLYWTKVEPIDVEQSIWKECDDSKIEIDENELEELFGQEIVAKEGGHEQKQKECVESIHILKRKTSDNIEIFLRGLKMDASACKDILLQMDEQKFPAASVTKLQKILPPPAEAKKFGGLEKEKAKNLAEADHFFYTIKNIDKDLPERLELWVFKMEFDKLLKIERDKLDALRDAHECIKTSKSLRQLFSIILAFGNYMNGGRKQGQAYGFKLDSLKQLRDCKSIDNTTTLMEYLYSYLLKTYPNLSKFPDEWKALESAVSVHVKTLETALDQIGAKLKIINNRCKAADTNSINDDKFISVMKPFHVTATGKFEAIKKKHKNVMEDLQELATFLNEEQDEKPTGAFLETLNDFRKEFIVTMKRCEERKKREEEKKKREQWKLNKQNKSKAGITKTKAKSFDDNKEDTAPDSKWYGNKQNKPDQMLAGSLRNNNNDNNELTNKLKRPKRRKNIITDK